MMRRPPLVVLVFVLVLATREDAAVFPCDEPGVLAALAAGGGPHSFSCGGPTTIVTSAELLAAKSVVLDGGGLLTLSGGHAHRVIRIDRGTGFGPDVTLRGLSLRDGSAPGSFPFGGCIYAETYHLTLEDVEIFGCEALSGGGVYAESYFTTVIDSTIRGNRGVGIRSRGGTNLITRSRILDNVGDGVTTGPGTVGAVITITDSTIAGNVGAGIYVLYFGTLSLSRSTISHNGDGGLLFGGGAGTIEDSTFVANLPVAMIFGQPLDPASDVHIRRSTVIGNAGMQPSAVFVAPDPPPGPHVDSYDVIFEDSILVGGCVRNSSDGGNIVTVGCSYSPGADQLVSKDALHLGKLGPHGGPTWTVPLGAASVAIDAAPGCTSATDQRGIARPFGAACDVGAFEWDGPAPGEVPALPSAAAAVLALACAALGARALRR
jgi:hypothetical protein